MAGLFANLPAAAQQGAVAGQYDPSALSGGDRLAMMGAMLRDIGGNFSGGSSNNLQDMRQMMAGRQLMQQQMALRGSLAGIFAQPAAPAPSGAGALGGASGGMPGGTPGAPTGAPVGGGAQTAGPTAGPDPSSAIPMLARAQAMGIDTGPYLDMLKMASPEGVALREGATLVNPRTGAKIADGPAKTGVSDGFGWKMDPSTGSVTWGAQRPMTYDDVLKLGQFQHTLSQDAFTNRISAGHLGVEQGNLGVNQGRLGFDRGKTPSVTPPSGFVVDKQ
jgi:hypothetical protein